MKSTIEVANILRLHPKTVRRYIKEGKLIGKLMPAEKGVRRHSIYMVDEESLEKYINRFISDHDPRAQNRKS